MHHGDRAALATLRKLDRAEQGRGVLELRNVRQETSDLDLRIDADLQSPEELDHKALADQGRCIGLLGLHGTYVFDPLRMRCKLRAWPEFQMQPTRLYRARMPNVIECECNELLIGRDVEQGSFARTLPHGRQCFRVLAFAIKPRPFDRQRQQVASGLAVTGARLDHH